jgi:hypothetical protein
MCGADVSRISEMVAIQRGISALRLIGHFQSYTHIWDSGNTARLVLTLSDLKLSDKSKMADITGTTYEQTHQPI